jgi:D-alanyl-D-alanine carboxypeptidase
VRALGAIFAFAVVMGPAVADAGTSGGNPSAERAKVRADKAKKASEVNALKATDAQVDRALADLKANVAGQQARVDEAQRAVNQAEAAYAEAQAAVEAKQAEIAVLKDKVREFAVQAFVHPPGDDAMATLDSENPSDAAERRALLDLQSSNDADVLDQLSAAQEDLQVQQDLAQQAKERATTKKAELQSKLDQLNAAKNQQQAYANQIQDRLDHALLEAANLEALDRQLSEQIRQSEIARAGRAGGSSRGGGGSSVGNVDTARASCPTGGGITVAASIVDKVQRLLDDAHADGVDMCGGGYRSSADQIATRKANGCPDVYTSPASSCHPPTAPPGKSMHERGLAIDFTQGGRALTRDSSGFSWLRSHAGSYGFQNLPSEPWHWSTNGN